MTITREVRCLDGAGNTAPSEALCSGSKPAATKACAGSDACDMTPGRLYCTPVPFTRPATTVGLSDPPLSRSSGEDGPTFKTRCEDACFANSECGGFDISGDWSSCYLKKSAAITYSVEQGGWTYYYNNRAEAPCQLLPCSISSCQQYNQGEADAGYCVCDQCTAVQYCEVQRSEDCACTQCDSSYPYGISTDGSRCVFDFNELKNQPSGTGYRGAYDGVCGGVAGCSWGGCYPNQAVPDDRKRRGCPGTMLPELPADTCLPFELDGRSTAVIRGTEYTDLNCATPAELNGNSYGFGGVRGGPLESDGRLSTPGYYGASAYVRLFRPLDKREGSSQFGYIGQWLQPDAGVPDGSPWDSIEGGMFSRDDVGLSWYPKYHAAASTHRYNPDSDTGRGWGFYGRSIPCNTMGLLGISNRVVFPPNMVAFEPKQETMPSQKESGKTTDDTGGVFIGSAWMGVPLWGGKHRPRYATCATAAGDTSGCPDIRSYDGSSTPGSSLPGKARCLEVSGCIYTPGDRTRYDKMARSEDVGKLSWTFFLDTANVVGPVLSYAPEFFYRRTDEYNRLQDKLDSKSCSNMLSASPQCDWCSPGIRSRARDDLSPEARSILDIHFPSSSGFGWPYLYRLTSRRPMTYRTAGPNNEGSREIAISYPSWNSDERATVEAELGSYPSGWTCYDWSEDPTTGKAYFQDNGPQNSLGFSTAMGTPSMGGEYHDLPTVFVDFADDTSLAEYRPYRDASLQGPSYWKSPLLGWPNIHEKELLMTDPRSYDESTYNAWATVFDPTKPADDIDTFAPNFVGSYATVSPNDKREISMGMRLSIPDHEDKLDADDPRCTERNYYNCGPKHISELRQKVDVTYQATIVNDGQSGSAEDGRESQVHLDWADGKGTLPAQSARGERAWGRYWKTVADGSSRGFSAVSVPEEQVPARLRELDYAASIKGPFENQKDPPTSHDPVLDPNMYCWACLGKDVDGCDVPTYTLTQEDGAVTEYRWYRFRDQPALRALKTEFPQSYSEAILDAMQAKVERMHVKWPAVGDWTAGKTPPAQFLKRPDSVPNMAYIEKALIVSPPAGIPEVGWIPIPIKVSYPGHPANFKTGETPLNGCRKTQQDLQNDGNCY